MSAEVWAVHSRQSAKSGTDQRQEAVQYHGTWGTHEVRVTEAWSGKQEMDTGKAGRWAGPKS